MSWNRLYLARQFSRCGEVALTSAAGLAVSCQDADERSRRFAYEASDDEKFFLQFTLQQGVTLLSELLEVAKDVLAVSSRQIFHPVQAAGDTECELVEELPTSSSLKGSTTLL